MAVYKPDNRQGSEEMREAAEIRTKGLTSMAIAVGTLALAFASPANANPGELDRSFGENARAVLALPKEGSIPSPGVSMDIAHAPSGKVVAASSTRVVKFLGNGRVWRGFGRNGRVEVSVPTGWRFTLTGVAIDSHGRILVAGTTESLITTTPGPDGFPGPGAALATVYRYLPVGKPDPSFGEGGRIASDLGQAPPDGPGPSDPYPYTKVQNEYPYATPSVRVSGIAVDPEDRPIVLGTSVSRVTACGNKVSMQAAYLSRTYVARLNEGGELDTAFGSGGVVNEPAAEDPRALALGPRGQIAYTQLLSEGCARVPPQDVVQLVGIGAGGQIEQRVPIEHDVKRFLEPRAAGFDRRGRIVLLTHRDELEGGELAANTTIMRLLANGSRDPSFGRGGAFSPHLAKQSELQDLAIDSHGRVLLVGTTRDKSGRGSFLLIRLSAAGKQEARFGRDGRTKTRFHGSANASSVSIDESGRILVGGTISSSSLSTAFGLAVARYLAD